MLESNFPVDRPAGSYRRFWNAFKRLASGASETERAYLFSRTAQRVYRLDLA
jgi:predicted TIM-barrel fold metal-dependent hydrolase